MISPKPLDISTKLSSFVRLTVSDVGTKKSHCQEPGYGSVRLLTLMRYAMCDVLIERRRKYVTHVIRAQRIVLQTHYNALTNKTYVCCVWEYC
jgi:hypothetical protein